MNCPKCQFENPEGKKFCGDCGHNPTLPSEPISRELSFNEKRDKIQKYWVELTQKTLATSS
jgi:uncharacterized membrane protein YvbJ